MVCTGYRGVNFFEKLTFYYFALKQKLFSESYCKHHNGIKQWYYRPWWLRFVCTLVCLLRSGRAFWWPPWERCCYFYRQKHRQISFILQSTRLCSHSRWYCFLFHCLPSHHSGLAIISATTVSASVSILRNSVRVSCFYIDCFIFFDFWQLNF